MGTISTLLRGVWFRILRFRAERSVAQEQVIPRSDAIVLSDGPSWLRDLLSPSVCVVNVDTSSACDQTLLRATDLMPLPPFVQPSLSNPLMLKVPFGTPPDYRSVAVDASCRRDRSLPSTVSAHRNYRTGLSYTADDVIEDALRNAGVPISDRDVDRVVNAPVSIVCVTARPEELGRIAANLSRQNHTSIQAILITNSDDFVHSEVVEQLNAVVDLEIVHADESLSLGECLNIGLQLASCRFVAKFDDDDDYGSNFLSDLMLAHSYARAGVVGKGSYHMFVEQTDDFYLRFPSREHRYCSHVAGATMVIDRERVGGLEFRPISVGEDQRFLEDSIRRGHPVYSADRFSFVVRRHARNSWDSRGLLVHNLIKSSESPAQVLRA